MMTWLVWATIAAILFSINSLLGRVLAVKSENPRAFALVYNTFGAAFALVLWWVIQEPLAMIPKIAYFFFALSIVLYGIFNRFEFYARKHVEVSVYTILTKFIPIITFILAIIFWRESLTLTKVLAASLILVGNVLAVYKKRQGKKINLDAGLKYAVIVIVSLGFAWTVDKKASTYLPLALYAFMTYFFPNVFLIFFPLLKREDIWKEIKISSWRIAMLALINVLGYYSLISAFRFGEASKVVLITSTSTVITVLAGIVLLKERTRVVRKIIATGIVTAGALLLK